MTLLAVVFPITGITQEAPLSERTYSSTGSNVVTLKQLSTTQNEQAELIKALLGRLEQLEKNRTEAKQQADSEEKAHRAEVQDLQGRIRELEAKVVSLESGRTNSVTPNVATERPTIGELQAKNQEKPMTDDLAVKSVPQLSVGPGGVVFSSADTNFIFKLRGLLQVDSRTFFDDNSYSDGNDGFYLRRARLNFEGTVFRDFDFQLVPDFGGSSAQIFNAWLNYRYRPELQLRVGKFKGPVGFENMQSAAMLPFNERSLVSNFLPPTSIGLQLWGDVAGGIASYAVGVFNESGDGRNPGNGDFGDHKEFAGRLAFQPFKNSDTAALQGFGFGAGGSYGQVHSNTAALPGTTGGTLPGYVTTSLQQFFAYNPGLGNSTLGTVYADGAHWRISPFANYTRGPFGLLGEYIVTQQDVVNSASGARANLVHSAWQASAQWVLTGEDASFMGIAPSHSFDPRAGKWGAWQLVARFTQAELDRDTFPNFSDPTLSAQSATSWGVGLNWWLNKNVRLLTSYSRTWFNGGGDVDPAFGRTLVPPATVTHQDESVFMSRFQLAF